MCWQMHRYSSETRERAISLLYCPAILASPLVKRVFYRNHFSDSAELTIVISQPASEGPWKACEVWVITFRMAVIALPFSTETRGRNHQDGLAYGSEWRWRWGFVPRGEIKEYSLRGLCVRVNGCEVLALFGPWSWYLTPLVTVSLRLGLAVPCRNCWQVQGERK